MKLSELDTFTRHYLIAALWSSVDDGGEPFDANFSVSDFHPSSLEQAYTECQRFQVGAAVPLTKAFYCSDEYQTGMYSGDTQTFDALAGHDFWLSRCGHGAGFFDRGNAPFWDELQAMAQAAGERDVYQGDDGELYFSPSN